MKKVLFVMVLASFVAAVSVRAEAPAAAPAKAPVVKKDAPVLQDLDLVGKIVQQEKVKKNKDGTEAKQTIIALDIAADGIQVALPPASKKDGVDPAAFVGKDVKVTAKGTQEVNKQGKKSIRIMKVVKIEAVEAAAAPAAAPVAAPAAAPAK